MVAKSWVLKTFLFILSYQISFRTNSNEIALSKKKKKKKLKTEK